MTEDASSSVRLAYAKLVALAVSSLILGWLMAALLIMPDRQDFSCRFAAPPGGMSSPN